jgi:hypothetical protein
MILEPDADTEGYRAIERDRERERETNKRTETYRDTRGGTAATVKWEQGKFKRKVRNQFVVTITSDTYN